MKSAIVMGAGWAGLAAAHDLSKAGLSVTVLEKAPQIGGQGRSFRDPASGQIFDNGQHILLTSYVETLNILGDCGLSPALYVPETLSLVFRGSRERIVRFTCPKIPAPLALGWGLMQLDEVPLIQKILALIGPILGAPFSLGKDKSVEELLEIWGQSEALRQLFWRPLVTGTLNTPAREASALIFLQVLWQGFLKHPFQSRFALPAAGLSEIFPNPLREVLEKRGVRFITRCPVKSISWSQGKIKNLMTRARTFEADLYVSTLPWNALAPLLKSHKELGPLCKDLAQFKPSAIVTVYIGYGQEVLGEPHIGLLDQPFDWAFGRGKLFGDRSGTVALVKSAADELVSQKPVQIRKKALEVMEAVFPESRDLEPSYVSVYKEPHATFRATPGINSIRPGPTGPVPNLFLGGAWTNTGLPSTLEGAVRSGRTASRAALEWLDKRSGPV